MTAMMPSDAVIMMKVLKIGEVALVAEEVNEAEKAEIPELR